MKLKLKSIIILFFLVTSCKHNSLIENGEVELKKSILDHSNEIKLNGNWNFFWNEYLTKNDFINKKKPTLVKIPGAWRGNYYQPNHLKPKGFGTFKMILNFEKVPSKKMGILFNDINSNGEIWINGILKNKCGEIFNKNEQNKKRIDPILVDLPQVKKIEILIPISQFNHRMGGGMLDAPILGNYNYLDNKLKKQIVIDSITTIIVFLISIFSLLFYFIVERKKIYLFFSIMCLMALLRQIVIGVGLISLFLNEIPFAIIQSLRYLGFYLGLGIGALYFNRLYPQHISKKVTNTIFIFSVLFSLYVVLTYNFYASYSAIPFQFFGLISISYVLIKLYFVLKTNDEISRFTLISMSIFLLTAINDILYTQLIIPTGYIQNIGFLIFALIQLYILMMLYKNKNLHIEVLSDEIIHKEKQIEFKERDIDYLALDNVNKQQAKKEIIEELESLIKQYPSENFDKIKNSIQRFKNEILVEENSHKSIIDTEQINSEFLEKLEQNFPALTKTEIEICQLIRLNLSTKEIAIKRKATDSSIKVAKHRIRNKVGVRTSKELQQLLIKL